MFVRGQDEIVREHPNTLPMLSKERCAWAKLTFVYVSSRFRDVIVLFIYLGPLFSYPRAHYLNVKRGTITSRTMRRDVASRRFDQGVYHATYNLM